MVPDGAQAGDHLPLLSSAAMCLGHLGWEDWTIGILPPCCNSLVPKANESHHRGLWIHRAATRKSTMSPNTLPLTSHNSLQTILVPKCLSCVYTRSNFPKHFSGYQNHLEGLLKPRIAGSHPQGSWPSGSGCQRSTDWEALAWCGPWTSFSSMAWELVRNANFRPYSRPSPELEWRGGVGVGGRICILINFNYFNHSPGDSDAP